MLAAVLRRLVLTVNNVKCRKLRCLSLLIARPKLHSLLVSATLPGPASSNTSQLSYLRTPSMFIKSLKEEDVKYSGKLLGVERKRLSQGVASSFASSDGNDKHHEFGKEIGHNETDYDVTYNNGESGSFSYITSCSAMSDVVELNATEQVEVTYHGGSKNGRHHGNGTMSFSGGSTYTGEFQHGFKHGQGKYVSNSGTFEGEYRNGDLVKGSVHYRSGNVYEGEFRSYKPHGVGKHIRKSTGDVYEGQFVAGRQHGTGRITHPNGTSFEGTFRNSQVESGKGVFLFANKDTFEGEIAAGMMQGAGTLTEADGTVWRGNWSQGEKEGHFTITSSQQGDFHGLFINDRIFSGKGVIRLSDGSVFEGSWVDGMRDGAGSYSLCDGTVYQGVWARSCLEGEGKCITSTGTVLEGTWLNGALVKQFPQPESATPCGDEEASSSSGSRSARVKTIEFPDGSRYVGQTRNGRKHGQGVYKSKSGSIYEGEYTDDVATGQGVLTYANGSTYSGEFYAGSAHGYGVLRDAYSVCEGEFKHGKQHGVCTYTPHSSPTSSTTQEQQQKQEQEGESSCADNSSGGNSNTYTSSYKPISLGISNSSGGGHIKDIVRIIQRDSVYQGKYQHGRRHGQGTTVHASFRHVGEYYKGMARGPGAVYYPNGDVYEGEIKHFLPHKVGKHISADGTVYTGSWESGERHGKCEIFYPDGETFVGEYQRGEPYIGKGRCVFSNGDVFEGEMKLGKLTGSGSYTESGNIFIGSWENGVKHGRFQVTWSNGAVLRMLYNRGKVVSGKGVLFSEDGSKIIGQWAQGQLHGRCKVCAACVFGCFPPFFCCPSSVIYIMMLFII